MTQCITLGTNGYCFSRRDWSEYSDTGCRVGYHAANLQRRGQSWFRREVCVPDGVSSGDGWWGGWTDDSEGTGFIYPDPALDPTVGQLWLAGRQDRPSGDRFSPRVGTLRGRERHSAGRVFTAQVTMKMISGDLDDGHVLARPGMEPADGVHTVHLVHAERSFMPWYASRF